jgi:hypothetical protein
MYRKDIKGKSSSNTVVMVENLEEERTEEKTGIIRT